MAFGHVFGRVSVSNVLYRSDLLSARGTKRAAVNTVIFVSDLLALGSSRAIENIRKPCKDMQRIIENIIENI